MRRFIAAFTAAALTGVFVYAPLFHVHQNGEHESGALLHAHFPEPEELEASGVEIESHHSHAEARPVDILVSDSKSGIHLPLLAVLEPLPAIVQHTRPGFLSVDTPRAHDPPLGSSSNPRSPPV